LALQQTAATGMSCQASPAALQQSHKLQDCRIATAAAELELLFERLTVPGLLCLSLLKWCELC
jgi:hypothetical protein